MSLHDLSTLNVEDLNKLIANATARIAEVKRENAAEVRRAIEAQAKAAGYNVHELFGGKAGVVKGDGRGKAPVAVKYRNPANPAETWSGRGKPARWFRRAIENGATPESLAA